MLLVVDANILFSALIASQGITRTLFSSIKLEFISPEFIEEEIDKYFSEIVLKSKCSEKDVRIALNLLLTRIKIMPSIEYESFREAARKISPDPKDAEYLAVALAFDCPLWSNDKLLKSQTEVKV
ncbi:MAG TPA: PIN domain-containing protein, partial [Candidatus Nanoarchaeia archaeon]|nr:PIN domain-containing protein [Candidatus Nanoarchaeia archaeon]